MINLKPNKRERMVWLLVGSSVLLILSLGGCLPKATPSPAPTPGGTVIRSDSVISGEITSLKQQPTGYPWEVNVLVESSEDVGGLPNPTKDKVGEVITTWTDEDLKSFQAGEMITANVKLAGDVEHGIILYIYNIQLR